MIFSRALILSIMCFSMLSSSVFGATLYACMEDEKIGMKVSENWRMASFQLDRFSAMIDVNEPSFASEKIYIMPFNSTCLKSNASEEFTCTTGWGATFTLNTKSNRFVRSYNATDGDDPFVAVGSCERF